MDIEYPNTAKVSKRKPQTVNKSIRLCSEAIVANYQDQNEVKKIAIDMLPTEHRRLVNPINLSSGNLAYEKVHKFFLNALLCRPIASLNFPIQQEYTDKLFEGLNKILDDEPTLLNVITTLNSDKAASKDFWRHSWTNQRTEQTL